jgi:hypothetical protein
MKTLKDLLNEQGVETDQNGNPTPSDPSQTKPFTGVFSYRGFGNLSAPLESPSDEIKYVKHVYITPSEMPSKKQEMVDIIKQKLDRIEGLKEEIDNMFDKLEGQLI